MNVSFLAGFLTVIVLGAGVFSLVFAAGQTDRLKRAPFYKSYGKRVAAQNKNTGFVLKWTP